MKNTIANKDSNYSLHNIENYNKELNTNTNEIIKKYLNLLVDYYKFIIENIKIKNKQFTCFIITRGLETITNVFLNLLLYTKNADLTYFHCQKSFYFYVEFVGQISEDEKMFLQLTSRDASTYVYKKTIFEINNEFKKMNDDMDNITREKFEIINFYTSLCKNYLLKLIEKNDFSKNEELINLIEESFDKLSRTQIKLDKLKLFEFVCDKLITSIENVDDFFEVNHHLVKKFVKNNNILNNCEKKIFSEDFTNKINNEPNDKFINWLLN
jgi:hypothetical protein